MICKIAAPAFSGLAMTNEMECHCENPLLVIARNEVTKQSRRIPLLVIARNPELVEGDEAISRRRVMPKYHQNCFANPNNDNSGTLEC